MKIQKPSIEDLTLMQHDHTGASSGGILPGFADLVKGPASATVGYMAVAADTSGKSIKYVPVDTLSNKVKTTTIGNVDATFKNQFEDFTIEGAAGNLDIIMFEGSDIAYTFGASGELKRSEDRGETWADVTKLSTYTGYILDSHFFSPSEGIVVGQNGIMHTVDGTNGTEWEIVHPFNSLIWRVDFVGDVGFASVTGNLLFKTTDRGRTWIEVVPGVGGQQARAITLLDENTIIFAYWDDSIFKSNDGGVTWRSVKIQNRSWVRDIKFIDDATGYAVDDLGTIQKTTDKGETWTALGIGHFAMLYRIYIADKNEIYFGGNNGIIIKTIDEGETAEKYYVGKDTPTTGFYKTSDNYLYVSGEEGTILRTKSDILSGINDTLLLEGGWEDMTGEFQPDIGTGPDTGATFRIFHIDENVGFCTGTNVGTIDGVIVGANQLVKTTDGGKTWEVVYTAAEGNLYGVSFSDELNGWMSGSAGKFYQTNDGGVTWTIKQLQFEGEPYTAADFNQIYTGSPNHMFSCKYDGSVTVTKDGGLTWLPVTGIQGRLGVLSFINETTGWLGMHWPGSYWKAKKTTDGGETWVDNWSAWSSFFIGVSAFDNNTLYLGSSHHANIYKSIDGGDTWELSGNVTESLPTRISSVKVDNLDFSKIWTSGTIIANGTNSYAFIKYSNDGGDTWKTQYKEPFHGWTQYCLLYMKDGKGLARAEKGQGGVRNLDSTKGLLDGFDNILFVKDNLVLLKDQTAATQNGVYLVKEKHPGFIELVREKSFDESDELTSSTTVSVESGTLYKDCEFMQKTGGEIIVGWTPLVWEKSFDPSTSNLFSKVENRIVTLEEATAGKIVLNADFTNVTVVFKNGIALYPTQYTLTGSTVDIPDIQENDTLIFILS